MAEKKKYKIAVYATYKRVVEIEAQSTDAAVAAVEAMWSDEHISMCPHDPEVQFDESEVYPLSENGKPVAGDDFGAFEMVIIYLTS